MANTFSFRLLDLPPELRESIYLFSFSTRRADGLQTPAITRTSALLRSESLPLFYKTQRFALNLLTEDAISHAKSWLWSLSRNTSLQPLLLIRRWTFLLRIDCHAVLVSAPEFHPIQALTYMGVNVDLDERYPGGRVREIRTSAIYAWIHSLYNMYYMKELQTPLSREEIERSDASALGFGGVLEDLKEEVGLLWVSRKGKILGAEDYESLLRDLRPCLAIHPTISRQRQINSRELGRHIMELDRSKRIAGEFMEAVSRPSTTPER